MWGLQKNKTSVEPKLETCISCNMPINDNPHYEVFLRDIIEGKIFSVHTHNSPNHPDCLCIPDIMKKYKYAKYLRTGLTGTFDLKK